MPENKVTYGLEKVHIAFKDTNSATLAWEKPQHIDGAVRWTPEAQGESSTFYAENRAYFIATSNNGYTGELEFALIPDAIIARMLGWEIDENGMLVEVTDGIPQPFAILGQVQGDQKNRRFVYYEAQASRTAKERTTKGASVEPSTDVLSVTVSPIEIAGKTIVKGDMELNDTNAAAYNAFFESVYTPVLTGTGVTGGAEA
ncbi:major tail protein [Paenibacillus sp. T2-29]